MTTPRCLLVLALLWLPTVAVADDAAERQRIAAERSAFERRFAAEESACRSRFVVTPCVEGVRARQREALAGLRHQELLLDDAERKRRGAARLQGIEARRAEAASRPPAALPAVRPAPASAAAVAPSRPARPASDAAEATAAARRAAAEARREAAAAAQARIAEREAARDPGNRKSAPLPVPANPP